MIYIAGAYQEFISQLEILGQSSFYVPVHMANRYSFLNQYDKAMDMLELGFEVHDQNMPYMASGYGKMDSLYTNPRFLAIMEKLNLPMPE